MVTAKKIRCVVVLASPETVGMAARNTPRFRPSDLLPWADPHIRTLVEQLQDEVRDEASRRVDAALPPSPESAPWPLDPLATDDDELMAGLSGRF